MKMHMHIAAALVAIAPGLSNAQNYSEVIQSGYGNSQATVQEGSSRSITIQIGSDNSANTTQSGKQNLSAIVQVGEGHERQHSQSGNYNFDVSTQVSSSIAQSSAQREIGGSQWRGSINLEIK
ncbi:hypothetical protein [Citreimonas salinaria]|uniref:Curlin associated repeat-containing protein n=1 Tax=Citreimonas salinaria TaxID=321339 RepID=A0A1H3N6W4_9RHOB|nr:hypothetical protein [Citreimonas salinaria]SDY83959.1 Curlin associated repeat-containing protein [Citreimonas salinaria]